MRPSSPRSSSPFLYPIMPSSPSSGSTTPTPSPHAHSLTSSHHTFGGRGKRSSRRREQEAQEMARLLDPSYQGASSQSTPREGQRRSLEVYVDRDGDLHDPDFRYFPAAETFLSQTRRDPRERRSATSPVRKRPCWDQDNEQPFLSDEEEEEELLARELGSTDFLTQAGHGNGTSASESSAMRSRRNRRDGSFSSYPLGFSGYPSSTNTHSISYYSPTMTTSTLPTSYDSENTLLTTELEGEKERDKGLLKRRRRGERESTPHIGTAKLLETTCEEPDGMSKEERQDDGEDVEDRVIEQADFVPTCTETLKRHWLSFSLRFRFGIYRSQRRFMGRVNSLF